MLSNVQFGWVHFDHVQVMGGGGGWGYGRLYIGLGGGGGGMK